MSSIVCTGTSRSTSPTRMSWSTCASIGMPRLYGALAAVMSFCNSVAVIVVLSFKGLRPRPNSPLPPAPLASEQLSRPVKVAVRQTLRAVTA